MQKKDIDQYMKELKPTEMYAILRQVLKFGTIQEKYQHSLNWKRDPSKTPEKLIPLYELFDLKESQTSYYKQPVNHRGYNKEGKGKSPKW